LRRARQHRLPADANVLPVELYVTDPDPHVT
jgi:hypothetical protein